MNREDHLDWCKRRALEYVEAGDIEQALASMARDLAQHEETRPHVANTCPLGLLLLLSGRMQTKAEARKWIEGFA